MNRLFSLLFALLAISFSSLFAEKGMVTIYDPNQSDELFISLIHLKYNLETTLPIEIWYDENEMDQKTYDRLTDFEEVYLKPCAPKMLSGCLPILSSTGFDEAIWFLPQISFLIDPATIFNDPWYQKKGSFFFRDLQKLSKENRREQAKKNLSFIRKLAEILKPYEDQLPYNILQKLGRKQTKFSSLYELRFCDPAFVVLNKDQRRSGLEKALSMIENPNFSAMDQVDLLWLGILLAGGEFHQSFVKKVGLQLTDKGGIKKQIAAVHLYQGKIFLLSNPITEVMISSENLLELVEPTSKTTRPLIDYESGNISELIQTYDYLLQ